MTERDTNDIMELGEGVSKKRGIFQNIHMNTVERLKPHSQSDFLVNGISFFDFGK